MQVTTVLLVDDNQALRETFADAIELSGMKVLAAANGARALELLEANAIDVIVTDMLMPDMDGLELIMELQRRQSQIPILLITGGLSSAWTGANDPTDSCLATARALGAVRTLRKPIPPSQLVGEIKFQTDLPSAKLEALGAAKV